MLSLSGVNAKSYLKSKTAPRNGRMCIEYIMSAKEAIPERVGEGRTSGKSMQCRDLMQMPDLDSHLLNVLCGSG